MTTPVFIDKRPQFQAEAELYATNLSENRKAALRESGRLLYIGHEQREGWTGKLPFYFFWCDGCQHFTKDYPHGFTGQERINCSNCHAHFDFVPPFALLSEAIELGRFLIRYPSIIVLFFRRRNAPVEPVVRS